MISSLNTVVILDFLPAFHLTLAVEHSQTTASTLKPRAIFILTLKIFMFTSIPHPKVSTETNVNKEIALIHPEKVKTLCRNWKHRSTLFMTHLYFIHLKGILFRIVTNLYFVWPNHSTMTRRALKVTYSFHHAIMVSQWFIILNSNPETRCQ